MDSEYIKIIHNNEPHEVTIPACKETFNAQVLVMAKERKEMHHSMHSVTMSMPYPLSETRRILASGKFHAELVMSSNPTDSPTLIIYED